ncbi:MAG: PAS domain S-box protein [Candidatus Saganbacteria bacterium]|nr:PAS domain S-box protein [Candidatus Saganbacteria bacterium]
MGPNNSPQKIRSDWLPLILVAATTLAAVAISIYCLFSGWLIVFQNLFYIPIIIACVYYLKRGFVFSVVLSFIYFFLILAFTKDSAVILQALIRVFLFVVIAGVITVLSIERKQAEKVLRGSEERFKLIYESSWDAIMTLEPPDWRFTSGNPSTIAMFLARDEADFTSRGPGELSPERQLDGRPSNEKAKEMIEKAVKEGSNSFEWVHKRLNGDEFPATVLLTRFELKGNTILQATVRDITERERIEHDRRERMKELQAFYSLAEITEREGITLDNLYQEFADILPKSWQYPEIACARIVIGDSEFRTKNFMESKWMQSAPVKVFGSIAGMVEVGYLEEKPEKGEGPFLKEERMLINAVAERIGRISERKRAEEMLKNSEERSKILFEYAPDAYYLSDLQGTFIDGNRIAEKLTGYKKDELIGKSFLKLNLLPLDQIPKAAVLLTKNILGQSTGPDEFTLQRKDGSRPQVEISTHPVKIKDQTLVLGIARDITERKLAEKKLMESEERWRSLVADAPNIIMITDTDGKISFMNRPFPGYSMEQVAGESMYDFVAPEHHDLVKEINGNVIKTAAASEYQVSGTGPKGQSLWYDIYVGPLLLNGKVAALTSIITDITERKWIEEEIGRYATELKRSNEDLQQFAYVASHDLQEPLRTIVSFIELLERRYKGKLDAEADEFISFVTSGASRMQQLILDLLTFSRVQTKGKELMPTDTSKVLKQTLEILHASLESNKAVVTNDPLPTVIADESQLIQLFQNLLGNAIKFHGKEPPRVHISARLEGERFVFSFRDNGIGIDPQYFDRLFQVFQRLHTKEEYAGTGIGLAVCKKIVVRHGGKIWLESKPGEGTTFYFTLKAV